MYAIKYKSYIKLKFLNYLQQEKVTSYAEDAAATSAATTIDTTSGSTSPSVDIQQEVRDFMVVLFLLHLGGSSSPLQFYIFSVISRQAFQNPNNFFLLFTMCNIELFCGD